MKREFIPGLESLEWFEGEHVPTWLPDEGGALRRSARIARRAFEVQPLEHANAAYVADLEWQVQCERMDYANRSAEQQARDEAEQEWAAKLHAGRADAAALGLVSVLSSHTQVSPRPPRVPRVPFRVQAERAAAVQAAGAFVPGGDEVRMAKLRRAIGFTARAHSAARPGHRPDEARMVTLTYRPGVEWAKDHMSRYMNRVRMWHSRRGIKCRYVWIAEIQDGKRRKDGGARGAVHYHVLLWVPVGTAHMPKSDVQGWWPHGSTRTEKADKAASYICSYLKKSNSKHFGEFPDGCRIYSVGGLEHSMRRARRWLGLPGFVQGNSSYMDDWRRAPAGTGGGWFDPSGVHWASEFRRVNCGGVYALQRVHTHARTIDACGPFAWLEERLAVPRV